MRTLAIDIETYSSADLKSCGVYKYTEAPDFEILLFGYTIEGGPVRVIDLSCETLNYELLLALTDPYVLKTAHNAQFERTCIAKHFGLTLDPDQWECTMAKAAQLGLPLSLDQVSKALGITDGKMAEGKKLIRYFSIPCKPTIKNGMRTRNLPEHDPEAWLSFKEYCAQDVRAEQQVREKISFFEIPAIEKQVWNLDQQINDRGILLDPQFVNNAIEFDTIYAERTTREAALISGLKNPNSVAQLKEWLLEETGEDIGSLNKETIPTLLKSVSSEAARRMLELRQQLSKTSVKKYAAMQKIICSDNRARGIHQYYGANRTGRWAGRLVQPQNMPKNSLKDLALARQLVKDGDLDMMEMIFGNVPNTISELIRTAFIAKPGHRFIVADFSAIEARVIAWLAGEKWRLDVFATHGKIYEASGAQMFKVPIESVTKGSPLRDKAKIAELALGYQGGKGALLKMGAIKMGLSEDELPGLVTKWRAANKKIVQFWYDADLAATIAVRDGGATVNDKIRCYTKNNIFWIELPSGRRLAYQQPKLMDGKFGPLVTYMGLDQTTKQWKRQETYGGKLVENIVQAVARDLLAHGLLELADRGWPVVLHVHDEIVCEMPKGIMNADEMAKIMSAAPLWAKGLPLAADAYETEFYKKD
jgi:DNA polymerase